MSFVYEYPDTDDSQQRSGAEQSADQNYPDEQLVGEQQQNLDCGWLPVNDLSIFEGNSLIK